MTSITIRKFSSLQIYRGLAAIFVVLYHITCIAKEKANYVFFNNCFGFGYTGVDFFFVLSGFIIFYTNWSDFGQKQKTLSYLSRRIVRIFPIYWIITGIKLMIIFIQPSIAKAYEKELGVILKSIFLLPQENMPIIAAAWTLSYELLFYMLITVFVFMGFRFGYKVFLGWAVAILGYTSLKIFVGQSIPFPFLMDFILNERNLEFIFGCLAAYLFINQSQRIKFPQIWMATGIILYAISGWFAVNGGNIFSYAFFFGLPSLFLVLGSSVFEAKKPVQWPKTLVFLGDASYSIYLAHAMFVNFFLLFVNRFNLFQIIPPLLVSISLAISVVISGCLFYYFVERPITKIFSQKIKRLQQKQETLPIVVAAEKTARI